MATSPCWSSSSLSRVDPAPLTFLEDAPLNAASTGPLRFFSAPEALCRALSTSAAALPNTPPNSMHRYGKVLLPAMNEQIMGIVRACLPSSVESVSHVHAFCIKYAMGDDAAAPEMRALAMHVDDSTYTINLCVSDTAFSGCELVFSGREGADGRVAVLPNEYTYRHKPFHGVIHRGSLQHWVENLTSGSRESIIIWVST
jgi:hypothetical protein